MVWFDYPIKFIRKRQGVVPDQRQPHENLKTEKGEVGNPGGLGSPSTA